MGGITFALAYFAPTLLAWYRVRNGLPISGTLRQLAISNLLIAWTVVGWFLVLANALGYNPVPHVAKWYVKTFGTQPGGPMPPPKQDAPAGSGQSTCGQCGGSGSMSCSTCNGRGSWYEPPTTATGSSELKHCGACTSSGRIRCTYCGGSGRVNY
jgi:hypothetical protein